MEKRNEYSPSKNPKIFLMHVPLERITLNNYLYLVTKKHKQKPNRLQETRSLVFHMLYVLVLCWSCSFLQLLTLCRRAVTSHSELLSSCSAHMGSMMMRPEQDRKLWPKMFLWGNWCLLKMSNINNI